MYTTSFHIHRARLASLSRSRPPDDPELVETRLCMQEEVLVNAITRALQKAPPITPQLRERIIALISDRAEDGMSIRTFSTAEANEQISPSERWLIEQLRAGRFPGRKVSRHWRMTEQDIIDALDVCRNDVPRISDVVPVVGLTPRSKKRAASQRRDGGG